jgi:Spy/CpxP family protein refolding chaperone
MFSFPLSLTLVPYYSLMLIVLGQAVNLPQKNSSYNDQLISRLHISPKQIEQIKEIQEEYTPKIEPLSKEFNESSQELNGLMRGTSSTAEIQARQNQMDNLKTRLAQIYFDESLAIRAVLSPTQRYKLLPQLSRNPQKSPSQPLMKGKP